MAHAEANPGASGRAVRRGSNALVAFVAFALVAAAGAYLVLPAALANFIVLVCLGVLASIGVVGLFAAAGGLIQLSADAPLTAGSDSVQDLFFENLAEGALISDSEGRPITANQAYLQLSRAESRGGIRSVDRMFSDNPDASDAMFRLATAADQGRRASEEIRIPDADSGSPRWYRVRVNPIAGPIFSGVSRQAPRNLRSGRTEYLGWTVADITREREHQENIFLELQNAIDYLDHAPAGFFSLEPDGRIRYINATLAEWVGLDLAEFEPGAAHIRDFVAHESLPAIEAAARGPSTGLDRLDIDLVRGDGTRMPVTILHRVPVSADGKVGASRTIVLDNSGVADPEAGRLAEMRFNRFFNNSPMAIAAIGRDRRIHIANARFVMLFQAGREGDPPADIIETVQAQGRAALAAAIEAALAGQDEIPAVDSALAAGPDRSVRFFISPIPEGRDGDPAALVYALETTEQRALEAQFAQSQKMQAVGQLAGGIAHDFNNVLTAIIGFSDLLLTTHRPTDPSFQDVMNIKQNANRAAGLVRQLLAFSRQQTLRPTVIALGDILSDLSVLLDRLLGERITLVVEPGRDIWPVKVDLNQLEQVIINLAVNARDAMPDGGQLTIRTENVDEAASRTFDGEGFKSGEYVLITVSDTGTGMPPEILEKIFEPFFSTKDVGKGTGLGLSTVYGIIKQTGGFIYVESAVGDGTTFQVLLPRHIPVETDTVVDAATAKAEPRDLTGNACILLVEDEEAVRAFAARALAARGYEVHEAESGTHALEVIEDIGKPVDLVVSDVVMPEMDGPTLLRELRKTQPDLKIIFVSGYAEEAFAKHLPEDESFQFLPKPFSLKELATAVKQTLDD